MPTIIFDHKRINGVLRIKTGMDDVSWGYNLNTAVYPTYGGEVVQILSAYTDVLSIHGTVKTNDDLERIYTWFLKYMEIATQGDPGERYEQQPIVVTYDERQWSWKIKVRDLPGFRYGREVVAPEWRVSGEVVEADDDIHALNLAAAEEGLKKLTLGIGYDADNPFSDPFADADKEKKGKKGDKKDTAEKLKQLYEDLGDKLGTEVIKSYMEGDYKSLIGEVGAKPAFLNKTATKGDQKKEAAKKKGSTKK